MRRIVIISTILGVSLTYLAGAVPGTITYQGVLKDSNGDIVADGSYSVTFRLYDAVTGGTNVDAWTETHSVTTTNGVFSVELGTQMSLIAGGKFDIPYWLEIEVGGAVLSPRTTLTSVPYAFASRTVQGSWNELRSRGRLGINTQGTADTTMAVVIDSGKVGIGTMIPQNSLQVVDSSNHYNYAMHINRRAVTSSSGAYGLRVDAYGYNSVSNWSYGGWFEATGGSSNGGAYGIRARAEAYGTGPAYAVYAQAISSTGSKYAFYGLGNSYLSGNMGIKSTTYIGSYALYVLGQAGGSTTWAQASDRRYKEHIRTLPDALEQLDKIRGIRFAWNERTEDHGHEAGEQDIGVIAQEIEEVFPELVSTAENGYKSVGYAKFTPILIEAVKELKAEKDALEKRVEALETALRKQQLGRVTTTSAGGQ